MAGLRPILASALSIFILAAAPAAAAPLALSVVRAYVLTEPATGQPALSLTLSPDSTAAFGALTTASIGKVVELRIDARVEVNASGTSMRNPAKPTVT